MDPKTFSNTTLQQYWKNILHTLSNVKHKICSVFFQIQFAKDIISKTIDVTLSIWCCCWHICFSKKKNVQICNRRGGQPGIISRRKFSKNIVKTPISFLVFSCNNKLQSFSPSKFSASCGNERVFFFIFGGYTWYNWRYLMLRRDDKIWFNSFSGAGWRNLCWQTLQTLQFSVVFHLT